MAREPVSGICCQTTPAEASSERSRYWTVAEGAMCEADGGSFRESRRLAWDDGEDDDDRGFVPCGARNVRESEQLTKRWHEKKTRFGRCIENGRQSPRTQGVDGTKLVSGRSIVLDGLNRLLGGLGI